MPTTTFCEILKATCSQQENDGICSICFIARNCLEKIAIKYRNNDGERKKALFFFDTPADTLSLRHFQHHPSIARIARGSLFDNSNQIKY